MQPFALSVSRCLECTRSHHTMKLRLGRTLKNPDVSMFCACARACYYLLLLPASAAPSALPPPPATRLSPVPVATAPVPPTPWSRTCCRSSSRGRPSRASSQFAPTRTRYRIPLNTFPGALNTFHNIYIPCIFLVLASCSLALRPRDRRLLSPAAAPLLSTSTSSRRSSLLDIIHSLRLRCVAFCCVPWL